MKTIQDIEKYISNIPPFSPEDMKKKDKAFTLDTIKKLLCYLQNPESGQRFIHIAGSNGKGSVSEFIYEILKSQGYRAGLFTSPYLVDIREEIRVSDEGIISESEFIKIFSEVALANDSIIKNDPSYGGASEFELMTAAAFMYFKEKNCDFVILEAGLGGETDATNVIDEPVLSVLTPISCEHESLLGGNIKTISRAKAGIIKTGGNVIISHKNFKEKDILTEIKDKCVRDQARLFVNNEAEDVNIDDCGCIEFKFNNFFELNPKGGVQKLRQDEDISERKYKIRSSAAYQAENAALAISSCKLISKITGIEIDDNSIKKGLMAFNWNVRFERVTIEEINEDESLPATYDKGGSGKKKVEIVIDGAHNPDGFKALDAGLELAFPKKDKIFIVGVLKDKEYSEGLKEILSQAKLVVCTEPDNKARALPAKDLYEYVKKIGVKVVCAEPEAKENACINAYRKSLKQALDAYNEGDVICVFGSLYFVGKFREMIYSSDSLFSISSSNVSYFGA